MLATLRSPRWAVGLLVAAAIVAGFVRLGFWQLSRLGEVRERNAVAQARLAAPEVDLDVALGDGGAVAQTYRRVTATGTYLPAEEVLLSPRSDAGTPGHHVLTPLLLDDGRAVVVDRGWVPLDSGEPPIAAAPPPAGEVAVAGLLFPPDVSTGFGPRVAAEGEVPYLGRVDLARLQRQVEPELVEGYLLAVDGPAGGLPRPADPPPLDEGSHLSYAFQWFAFALVVGGGFPLLVRRAAADRARDEPRPAGVARVEPARG